MGDASAWKCFSVQINSLCNRPFLHPEPVVGLCPPVPAEVTGKNKWVKGVPGGVDILAQCFRIQGNWWLVVLLSAL